MICLALCATTVLTFFRVRALGRRLVKTFKSSLVYTPTIHAIRVPPLQPTGEVTATMDKDSPGTPPTIEPGGGSPSVGSISNTMDDKDTLGGGSTNDDPFLSTDDPGGGKHPVRSGHQAIRWTTRTILTTAAPMMIPVSVVIPTLPTPSRLFRIPMSRVSLLI